MNFSYKTGGAGFTLLELIIAIAILALLLTVVLTALPRAVASRQLDRAVSDSINLLEEARQLTLASKDEAGEGAQYSVAFSTSTNPDSAILFKGSSGSVIAPSQIVKVVRFNGIEISDTSFSRGTTTVVFQRLTGRADNPGSITFHDGDLQRGFVLEGGGHITEGNRFFIDQWTDQKKIKFNSPVSETLKDFPVLLRFNSSNVDFSKIQNSGADLRFTDANDSTILPYEVEKWDEASNEGIVWVKVPNLSPGTGDYIYMYYGSSTAASGAVPSSVWDDYHAAVWHLSEEVANGIPGLKDSTKNGNHARPTLNAPADSGSKTGDSGMIGQAVRFDGVNDYVEAPNSLSLNITKAITLSSWVRLDAFGFYPTIIAKSGGTPTWNYLFSIFSDGTYPPPRRLTVFSDSVTTWANAADADSALSTNTWTYTTVSYSGSSLNFYVNGNPEGTYTLGGALGTNSISNLRMGGRYDNNAWFFLDGNIDEARISNIARSADWIRASYENQKSGSTFVTIE